MCSYPVQPCYLACRTDHGQGFGGWAGGGSLEACTSSSLGPRSWADPPAVPLGLPCVQVICLCTILLGFSPLKMSLPFPVTNSLRVCPWLTRSTAGRLLCKLWVPALRALSLERAILVCVVSIRRTFRAQEKPGAQNQSRESRCEEH